MSRKPSYEEKGRSLGISALIAERIATSRRRFFPRDLFLSSGISREPAALRIESFEPTKLTQAMDSLCGPKRAVAVLISPHLLLKREVALPRAALKRADEALSVIMRQSLPAHGKGLIWRAQLTSRTQVGATFTVLIAKAEQLDLLRQILSQGNRSIRSIGVDLPDFPPFYSVDQDRKSSRPWWIITLLGAVGALLWLTILPHVRATEIAADNSRLEAEIDVLRGELLALRTTSDESAKVGAKISDAIAALNRDRQRPALLAALTEALPDDTWASELTITGNNIYLAAFTKADVTEILNRLAAQPWAETARLDGPIITDTTSGEGRFQAVIAVKMPP